MKRIRMWGASSVVLLALSGCHSKDKSALESKAPQAAAPASAGTEQQPAGNTTGDVISAARASIKEGNVDEAAAKLAQLQMQGASFNQQQAKDYRQALSEAYDRAIEAAQRGDPKAQAALQLLRAAAPR